MNTIGIMLAAYNPSEAIFDQIESVLSQTTESGHFVKIIIKDDASTDPAAAGIYKVIKDKWSDEVDILYSERNAGPAQTFLSLVSEAIKDPDIGYIGFCDQDDVWLPGKLNRAVSVLASKVRGDHGLYCGRVYVTDAALRRRGLFPPRPVSSIGAVDYRCALVENLGVGCSMVLNRQAAELVSRLKWPADVFMHDAWCFLVVSVLGTVVFDPTPYVLYRQHGGNVLGTNPSGIMRLWARFIRRLKADNAETRSKGFCAQVESLIDIAKEHAIDIRQDRLSVMVRYIEMRSSLVRRMAFVVFGDIRKVDCAENVAFRVRVLLNRY